MRILVTGSIAYDLLLTYDGSFPAAIDPAHLEELSVAFVTPHFARHHGGTGANIAWNLRLINQDPLLVGTVGRDGGEYLALLRERGVATDYVEKLDKHVTSTAIVATDDEEHQITFYHPGADSAGSWPDLNEERESLVYAIISPRDVRVKLQALQWCQQYRVPYLFDPGQQVMAYGEDELRRAVAGSAGVIANAYEWGLLAEQMQATTDDVLEMTPFLVVTHSEQGLTIYERAGKERGAGTIFIPACKPDRLVNPTGAGDALRAGFLTGLAAGWTVEQAGRLGAAMGSFAVECEGTLMDSLDLNELLGRAEVTYGEVLPPLP